MKYLFIGIFKFYKRFISPLLPNACRFRPTCS
ncbi:MAG: membrane protein insertion efficiency factor YidD, partial [Oscillospiraceae bacterium]|nr:membrane protein insertion efficiency factor YidD [Oscillospiraceae bacterium]